MAKDLIKNGTKALAHEGGAAPKKHAKKAAKKHAKKAAKHAGEKMAGKKHETAPGGGGFQTAFHHMQRASAVISLMEKGAGKDLKDLLARGVKLYESAIEDGHDEAALLKAIGLLRAAEHLSMAGLYDARHKHRQKVKAPDGLWLEGFIAETNGRLKRVEDKERGKGPDLFPVAEELVRQAEDTDHDPHMAYELVMAADALCFALENGL